MNVTQETVVETYSFRQEDLSPETRRPGISAFMRIKNGTDFLEATIRSHIDYFDEIVAVYNQCTDTTPDILARLAQEFGPKLRVFHYLPKVFPPGSVGHAKEPPNSPRSLVNYYNFALTQTRCSIATKLDDDHLAMRKEFGALVDNVRGKARLGEMLCFSGLNLARAADGTIGILAAEPFSGGGDIGFFPVSRDTYFAHDARFERFRRGGLKRRFAGIVYWHLKYLKPEFGFANYDLHENPDGRYARKLTHLKAAAGTVLTPAELASRAPRALEWLHHLPFPEKTRLAQDRWIALRRAPPSPPALAAAGLTMPAA
jgi:hypothetical protein